MASPKKSPVRPLRTLTFLAVLIAIVFGTVAAGTKWSDATWTPSLALDLEGGTQLILTPKTEDGDPITSDQVNEAIRIIRQRVDASGVAEAEITSQGGQNIVVALPGSPSEETLDLVRRSAQMRFRPVLVEAGPGQIDPAQLAAAQEQATDPSAVDPGAVDPGTVDPTDTATDPATDPATEETTEPAADGVVRGTVGTTGTEVTTPPSEEPTEEPAEEPTATSYTQEEIEAAAMTASDTNGDGVLSDEPTAEPTSASDQAWITEQLTYDFYMLDCTDPANLVGGGGDDPDAPLVACADDGTAKYILGPMEIAGTEISSASSGLQVTESGTVTNDYVVNIEFTSEGGEKFATVTERLASPEQQANGTNRFAMVLDGLVISAPSVTEKIPSGEAQISGSSANPFTRDQATALANQLNFGALPITFEVQSEEQISATLGTEQLERGLLAGLIGLILVVIYSLIQYRGLAVVTVASLVVAGSLVYGVIAMLSWVQGYRLSLPGVAGLIVAIGITADSFIVYFERIRDEVREGRRLDAAVEEGWKRARRTILASDAVNLLAAIVLYFLAVGGVRGFAFTLGLTTIIDLIVVMLFTHPMVQLLTRTKFFGEGHRLSGLDPEHLGATVSAYKGRGRFRSAEERMSIAERRRRDAEVAAESAASPEPAEDSPDDPGGSADESVTSATAKDGEK
ncbi:protein translocase subunit SecD [Occultella glacieicola]|uniref:Protein translocase subunit SecD n=1 Tax=Occultella glacieicola TaxID=2518684 RepID=A0ABY2E1Y9_9MICO|nr:protein translocase subunit SecD [Occultella glacieicola]TDE92463.1 protein translocase subunit SecD [Occultella glacieicola]